MMKFFKEKKTFCFLTLFAIFILGLIGFLVYKFYYLEEQQAPKIERLIPVREAKENFESIIRGASLSGRFLSFDEEKSELYVNTFNTSTMKVVTRSFRTDEHTIFSKMTFEFDQFKLFPKEDLKNIPVMTQVLVFYSYSEKQTEVPVAKMIQFEDSSQSLFSPSAPSSP